MIFCELLELIFVHMFVCCMTVTTLIPRLLIFIDNCQFKTLGENGQPVYTGMEERTRADKSVREFGFNMINSDKISMNRTIPDTRVEE